jgi:hypothetical protein
MLYISILEDLITDPNTEEQSTISTSEKEDLSTGLFLLEIFFIFCRPTRTHYLDSEPNSLCSFYLMLRA